MKFAAVALLCAGCVHAQAKPVRSAAACQGVTRHMPAAQTTAYLQQIAKRSSGTPAASTIKVDQFMALGRWSAVFSTPPNNERGVFFFHTAQTGRPVLADVWGGVAGGDSAASIADWTKTLDLNFPRPLALCFAHAVGGTD